MALLNLSLHAPAQSFQAPTLPTLGAGAEPGGASRQNKLSFRPFYPHTGTPVSSGASSFLSQELDFALFWGIYWVRLDLFL